MKSEKEIIKQKVASLEDSFPQLSWDENELWEKIDSGSEVKKTKRFSFQYLNYGIAASFVLALVLVNYFLSKDTSETLTYDVSSIVMTPNEDMPAINIDQETMAFIDENCVNGLAACSTSEFKELKSQLDEATHEIDNINDMISRYGDSPSLVKSKVKIENFRSQVMRQLVQIITS